VNTVIEVEFRMSKNTKAAGKTDEPIFTAISQRDFDFQLAYNHAAQTTSHFVEHIQRGGEALRSAKLRFRDPDESERLGEDRFFFLWLGGIHYYADDHVFSGIFFEVPSEFHKWHQVGQCLLFEAGDIFDWMVNDGGHLYGGFTLRVAREKLPEPERESYDRYVGVSAYEPLPSYRSQD
jgi:uncharacterized protein YegJ (DUF2314 family)